MNEINESHGNSVINDVKREAAIVNHIKVLNFVEYHGSTHQMHQGAK